MSRSRTTGGAALAVLLLAAGCSGPTAGEDLPRARASLDLLAGTIGSRPAGSPAAMRAREYVIGELQRHGFAVRTQAADAVDDRDGLTVPVVNVIALRQGALDEAIALVSHYDSVPDGPGALDDALGVATCLESARVLASAPTHASLMVIVTDAEELGLMGARAAVRDPEVQRRVRAFLNFDGTGASGPPVLFQTGPGLSSPLAAWTRAAAPFGGSFGAEIYKRLPNDTDFTIFKTVAAGLNFAPVGDSYAYHTDRDAPSRVSDATLQREIANTITTVRRLDAIGLSRTDDVPTFFDIGGTVGVVYGSRTTLLITIVACALGAVGWVILGRRLRRAHGAPALVVRALWAIAALGVAALAMTAVAAAFRAWRGDVAPWYAAPQEFFAWLAAAAGLALWIVGRISAAMPAALRPIRSTAAAWWVALPVWIAAAAALQAMAPGAAFLAAWPLAVAGLLALPPGSRVARAGALVVTVVAALLWVRYTLTLLGFLVPLFGWLPLIAPAWLYPSVLLAAGLFVVPPVLALLARANRPWPVVTGLAWGIVTIACAAALLLQPSYTADRPQRRILRYVQDDVRGQAWWEVAGPEPGMGVEMSRAPAGSWQRATSPLPTIVRVPGAGSVFAHRMLTTPIVSAGAADVAATWTSAADGQAIFTVSIVPRDAVSARIVLPRGVVPAVASIAGVTANNQWTGNVAAIPAGGVQATFTVPADSREAFRKTVVILYSPGVPGGTGPYRLPTWVRQDVNTWNARTVQIVPAGPAGSGGGSIPAWRSF